MVGRKQAEHKWKWAPDVVVGAGCRNDGCTQPLWEEKFVEIMDGTNNRRLGKAGLETQ